MYVETYREFAFDAAHELPPFSGLHGHTFVVRVWMRGEPDPVFGWAANLYEVDAAISRLKMLIDHKNLNDVEGLEVPSLENLASWVCKKLSKDIPNIHRVDVERGFTGTKEGCVYYQPEATA